MEPKDKNNTFVLLKTIFNNIGTEKINGEELPRATMIYNDEHRYDITVLTDEGDGSELNTYNFMMDIEPSLSRKIWYAAEIPKEIATESNFIVELKIRNRIFHIILEELSYPDDNVTEQLDVKQKINAYMFWGDGCPHCENAHEFFKTIEKKYESCYKLVDYEVWNDKTSADLMKKVEGHFNEKNLGVPLIVIGNKHFMGYAPSYDEDIIEAIKKSCTSSNYVDIVSNIQNNK